VGRDKSVKCWQVGSGEPWQMLARRQAAVRGAAGRLRRSRQGAAAATRTASTDGQRCSLAGVQAAVEGVVEWVAV
jgi:hypothetical protein